MIGAVGWADHESVGDVAGERKPVVAASFTLGLALVALVYSGTCAGNLTPVAGRYRSFCPSE